MNINEIKNANWCLNLKEPFNSYLTGVEEVNQCINLLLFTPVGTIPGNPEKGSRIDEILDLPILEAIPLIVKEIHRIIPLWIPKIKLVKVKTKINETGIIVFIEWRYLKEKSTNIKEVGLAKST